MFADMIIVLGVGGRTQRKIPGDCLSKTQVSANPQGDVWGLTPDQCWNVNGSGASQSPKRQ